MPCLNRNVIIALLALVCLAQASSAQTDDDQPDERIRSFDSRITLSADANLEVRETIEVQAAGVQIRHGIYREFPTRYRDKLGILAEQQYPSTVLWLRMTNCRAFVCTQLNLRNCYPAPLNSGSARITFGLTQWESTGRTALAERGKREETQPSGH